MRIHIKLQNEVYIPISEARQHRIAVALQKADYSTIDGVKAARDEITYMGPFDSMMDEFYGGCKQEALEVIADLVLCQQASIWHSKGKSIGEERLLADSVNEDSRQRSQAAFIKLVSKEALQGMARHHQDVDGGVRFTPQTYSREVNALLDVVLPYEHAAELFAKAEMPREAAMAWETASRSNGMNHLSDISRSYMALAAQAWEDARDYSQAAKAWDAAGDDKRAAELRQEEQVRKVVKEASDQVIAAGPRRGRARAMSLIKDLPLPLRLGAFLQLIDRAIINNPPTKENLHIFSSIRLAARDLERGDQRKLLTKLLACVPYMDAKADYGAFPTSNGATVWDDCFVGIQEINAAEPQDMGPAVVALVDYIPDEYLHERITQTLDLIDEISKLKDGDPHKTQAQTALVDRLRKAERNGSWIGFFRGIASDAARKPPHSDSDNVGRRQ